MMDWRQELEPILPNITAWRRALHQHPELSGQETNTRQFIIEKLRDMGLEVKLFDDCNGVMGVLHNGEGKCFAIRADMDALPIREADGLPFVSQTEGVMHACGHDCHMAFALGSALWMSTHRDQWHGTVKWLFEPAEETVGGGQWMVAQGCMENPVVDCVIGQHVNPSYPAGVFFSRSGCVSGSSDELYLTVYGKNCHGAYPERGVDAIVITAQIISALQSLVSRTISPFEPAALTFGTINGGTANNIVCGEVKLKGTLRTLHSSTRRELHDRMNALCAGIAQGMGGSAELEIRPSYGAVYNDDAYYAVIEHEAKTLLGESNVITREAPSLGVESFCYFLDHTKGVYYDIGSGIGTALHTDTFLVDEAVLEAGVALQCASLMAMLREE